jgi:hypothetical protein
MQPEFQDESPVNPFDFWEGANFKLKIRKVEGYWNYDKSEFAAPSLLGGMSDSELEALWRSQHSLNEFMDAKNFKSYAELESRLNVVLGRGGKQKFDAETAEDEDDFGTPDIVASSRPNFAARRTVESAPEPVAVAAAPRRAPVDDDDTLSYFARLAEED